MVYRKIAGFMFFAYMGAPISTLHLKQLDPQVDDLMNRIPLNETKSKNSWYTFNKQRHSLKTNEDSVKLHH